ncbi:MAG: hypothetical protein KAJ19_15210, partial [Gammaproteobacteria bacterium]|nr:hypothetical protein [Gammaproteobacteria bacterium]
VRPSDEDMFFERALQLRFGDAKGPSRCIVDWDRITSEPRAVSWDKHCAFVAGFFGFHYTHFLFEQNLDALSKTRRNLIQAYAALGLDEALYKEVVLFDDCALPTVAEFVRSTVAQYLGRNFGQPARWMVELGYLLALIVASLVGQSDEGESQETSEDIDTISGLLPKALEVANNAEIPDIVTKSIINVQSQLEKARDRKSVQECVDILVSVVEKLLVTDLAMKFLASS